jgi:hypothetical protein
MRKRGVDVVLAARVLDNYLQAQRAIRLFVPYVSSHQLRTCRRISSGPSRAISGPSAPQQTACLLNGLPNLHDPRHSDCKGRTTTGLALDRDVATHHLAETPTNSEAKAGASVFARRGGGSLGELLEQLAYPRPAARP